MSVDEALLESANETGITTLRFYQWADPTLSLGYFQKSADRNLHSTSSDCQMVRRSSGGGAILHDQEITYSLSLPGTNRWSSKQNGLYDSIHYAIVKFLKQNGVLASLFEFPVKTGTDDLEIKARSGDSKRFLCFERRTKGDIVVDDYKVGGSAQRRLSNATLQHGSLLIQKSSSAPELPGILDLAAVSFSIEELTSGLIDAISDRLELSLAKTSLSEIQKKNAEEIWINKYGNSEWTAKK